MHILLTNDDGPLSPVSSPYIPYLVEEIVNKGWQLSIVVPATQKSWIGKAHFAGKSIGVSYLYTPLQRDIKTSSDSSASDTKTSGDNIFTSYGPFAQENPQYQQNHIKWILIDSTPAACVDIAINHLVKDIDLVISGPNFGKNSSNLYILASGTVGAAMESVLHNKPSIAISYSYDTHPHPESQIRDASVQAIHTVHQLWDNWHRDVECYSVNVPLGPEVKHAKAVFAPILNNKWGKSIYELVNNEFKWNPDFKKVYKDGLQDLTHSDNQVLLKGNISVTPLKARFMEVEILGDVPPIKSGQNKLLPTTDGTVLLDKNPDDYIYDCITKGFQHYNIPITNDKSTKASPLYHYTDYETIDFDRIQHDDQYFIPSYVYRKSIIRKHYLSQTIKYYTAKHPQSILSRSVPESFRLELDYAEFLDDALDECEWMENGDLWILKPGMSDKGQGIRIFKTQQQLQDIFNSFEEEESDDEGDVNEPTDDKENNGIIISQLRDFIIQKYIPPLLLPSYNNKKFHLRVYVVASGCLTVWVNNEILVLFADSPYQSEINDDDEEIDMKGHLTNSCLQDDPEVITFSSLNLTKFEKSIIFNQICQITRDLFLAANADKINFQTLPNATEVYGIDFLVDNDLNTWLIEVNAYPDFKQSGDLKFVVDNVWKGIAGIIATKFGQEVVIDELTEVLNLEHK